LARPDLQQIAVRCITQQQQQQQSNSVAAADLASFTLQLRTVHAALVVAVQELLESGTAAAAAATSAAAAVRVADARKGVSLLAVDSLLQQLLSVWQSLKDYQEQAAAEAAQLFKHKTQTSTFLTEEVN
jgi:hypothetical protein